MLLLDFVERLSQSASARPGHSPSVDAAPLVVGHEHELQARYDVEQPDRRAIGEHRCHSGQPEQLGFGWPDVWDGLNLCDQRRQVDSRRVRLLEERVG
jgi:hypothetical protein